MFKLAKKNQENQITASDLSQNYWWQFGLKLTFQLSGWLVGPLILALFLGNWLDWKYQTKPWLFLLTTAVGFIITCAGVVLQTTKFIKQIENLGNKKFDLKK